MGSGVEDNNFCKAKTLCEVFEFSVDIPVPLVYDKDS